MHDDVQALRALLPSDGLFPKAAELRRLAREVLHELHGGKPKPHNIDGLIARLKQLLQDEADDAAFFRSVSDHSWTNANSHRTQAGGGRRVIRKPGLFGG